MSLLDALEPPWVKPLLVAVVLALAGAGGWWLRDQSAQATIAKMKSSQDKVTAQAVTEALTVQSQRFEQERQQQQKTAAIDKAEFDKLQGVRDENNRLRDCLRTGTCGLRIAAKCPASGGPGNVPGSAPSSGVGSGGTAELDGSAQQAYLALRDGIATASGQLHACQATLKTLTGQ